MSVRSRIKQNQQLTAEETKTNFSEIEEIDVSVSYKQENEKVPEKQVPEKYFLGVSNLKSIMPNDYRERRRDIKHDKFLKYWENQINDLLTVYDGETDKYHIQLVKSIMQIAEDYVIFDRKTGPMKKSIVKNICLKFFDDNEKLLNAIIEDQLKNIVHSTLFRRLCSRMQVSFFSKL